MIWKTNWQTYVQNLEKPPKIMHGKSEMRKHQEKMIAHYENPQKITKKWGGKKNFVKK
jgi:hypothetical protein